MDKRPKKLIPLLIYFLKIVLSKKLGPVWVRVLAAVLLGLLLVLQVVCGGFLPT